MNGADKYDVIDIPWCYYCGVEKNPEDLMSGQPICSVCRRKIKIQTIVYPRGSFPVRQEKCEDVKM